jgi:hypothetical protein
MKWRLLSSGMEHIVLLQYFIDISQERDVLFLQGNTPTRLHNMAFQKTVIFIASIVERVCLGEQKCLHKWHILFARISLLISQREWTVFTSTLTC